LLRDSNYEIVCFQGNTDGLHEEMIQYSPHIKYFNQESKLRETLIQQIKEMLETRTKTVETTCNIRGKKIHVEQRAYICDFQIQEIGNRKYKSEDYECKVTIQNYSLQNEDEDSKYTKKQASFDFRQSSNANLFSIKHNKLKPLHKQIPPTFYLVGKLEHYTFYLPRIEPGELPDVLIEPYDLKLFSEDQISHKNEYVKEPMFQYHVKKKERQDSKVSFYSNMRKRKAIEFENTIAMLNREIHFDAFFIDEDNEIQKYISTFVQDTEIQYQTLKNTVIDILKQEPLKSYITFLIHQRRYKVFIFHENTHFPAYITGITFQVIIDEDRETQKKQEYYGCFVGMLKVLFYTMS